MEIKKMVKLKNPKTGKMEEIDEYHYFDVVGRFPSTTKKRKPVKKFNQTELNKIKSMI